LCAPKLVYGYMMVIWLVGGSWPEYTGLGVLTGLHDDSKKRAVHFGIF